MLSTSTTWLLIGTSAVQIMAGIAVGWWLRSARRAATNTTDVLTRRLTEALTRLQSIAGDISLDASAHAEQLQAVHERLGSAGADSGELHRALLDGMSQIISANDRLQSHLTDVESRLEEQSRHIDVQLAEARLDALTATANRRAFDDELNRRMAEWRRRQTPISLLMIDVDHFKKINDGYGHQVGDAVLKEIARVLQTTVREMDFVARYGGEEFSVILPSTGLRDARRAAQRVLEAVAGHRFESTDGELDVTVSVGVAEVAPGDDGASLVRRADEALYLSKAAGRNCGHFHLGADCLSLDSPRLVERLNASVSSGGVRETPAATPAPAESIDPLTGLPLATMFSAELRRRVQQARSATGRLTLVLVDVDHLNRINAHIGRDAGDLILRHTADALRGVCGANDYLARYHQGQFALILQGAGTAEGAATAERVRQAVRQSPPLHDDGLEVSVSCGVAECGATDRAVALVMRAGVALSAAKSAGRDCVFIHDGQCAEPADAELQA